MVGKFAISKSGHDRNQLYVIIREDDEYVYLCNGRNRTLENLKRKRKKHIQIIKQIPQVISQTCYQNDIFYNEGIKKALKEYGADKAASQS